VKVTDADFWKIEQKATVELVGIYAVPNSGKFLPVRLLSVDHAIQHLAVNKYLPVVEQCLTVISQEPDVRLKILDLITVIAPVIGAAFLHVKPTDYKPVMG